MTTTIGAVGTRATADLLYLKVDLGDRPGLEDFGRNTAALMTLARYATSLVVPGGVRAEPGGSALPFAPLGIVRTSLASPWVTVLADLAKTSSPIAYGGAALFALHRLLQMVMTWQRHRLDIAERDLQVQHLRDALQDESRRQKTRFFNMSPEELTRVGQFYAESADMADLSGPVQSAIHKVAGPLSEIPHLDEAVEAAQELGDIEEAEMISHDDPRATRDHRK